MIPKLIHGVWFGSDSEKALEPLFVSVIDHNPGWGLLTWDENSVGLLGVEVSELWADLRSWAAVSNYVRLLALQKYGGIYLDADVVCHKPLEQLLDNAAFAAEQDGGRICNAVLGTIPDHWWINWQLAHWKDFDQRDPASGVYLASAAPREGVTIVPQHLVYPWLYDAPMDRRKPHADSILEHQWAGSWVQKP